MKDYKILVGLLIIPIFITAILILPTLGNNDDHQIEVEQQLSPPGETRSEDDIILDIDMPELNLSQPEMVIDENITYQAIIKTTQGEITIQLNTEETPITANNFIYLAENNFYDNIIFHRVIEDFMIQGGCPHGDGTGGPGYQFDDEPFTGEYNRGTVAMANSGPNTNGSQFFIMHQEYNLPNDYVIFGQVTSGLDVVDKIATSEVSSNFAGENSVPVEPTRITAVEIIQD